MGNYCKQCSSKENNQNTIIINTDQEEHIANFTPRDILTEKILKLEPNINDSLDLKDKLKKTPSQEKIPDNKHLSDFEILEKNLKNYHGSQKSKTSSKILKDKLITDKLLQRKNAGDSTKSEINIIILGDSEVGKSSFAIQYIKNKFEQYHVATIGVENLKTFINCNDTKYMLNFIITSGLTQYKTDYTSYFEAADFFFIFYDITNSSSFSSIPDILTQIKNYNYRYKNDCSNIIIVGNKCDLKNREVVKDEVKEFCLKKCLKHYEISVKSKSNIQGLIEDILCTYHNF